MIDNIEYNVKSAIGWVTNGAGDLNTAYKSRKRQRKVRKLSIFLFNFSVVANKKKRLKHFLWFRKKFVVASSLSSLLLYLHFLSLSTSQYKDDFSEDEKEISVSVLDKRYYLFFLCHFSLFL